MPVTYTPPVLITYANSAAKMCLQAASALQDSLVTLQAIDYTGETPLQLWMYGSDKRIYLYGSVPTFCLEFTPPVKNGAPLVVQRLDTTDQNQLWNWDTRAPAIMNVGASTGANVYVIDNNNGDTDAGNLVQIYTYSSSSGHQLWEAQLLPSYNLLSSAAA